jgi:hypothetical protein
MAGIEKRELATHVPLSEKKKTKQKNDARSTSIGIKLLTLLHLFIAF